MYADQPLAYSRMGVYSSQLQGVGFWNPLSTEIANCSGARRGLSYSSWWWFWRISIQACVFSHLSHWAKTPGLECDWVSKAWFNWHCKQLMARFLLEEGYHLPSSQPADWQLMEGGGGEKEDPLMILRQEVCVTLCGSTKEIQLKHWKPLCSQCKATWSLPTITLCWTRICFFVFTFYYL